MCKKASSIDEESKIIDHIRSLKYKGIGTGNIRPRQPHETNNMHG